MTVKTAVAVVPAGGCHGTLRAPVAAVAEIVSVAVIWVALTRVTLLTVISAVETLTVAPARKFVPVRVTGTVAPWMPLEGAMEVRVGAAVLTVKTAAAVVPPEVVTETLRAPVGAVAEIVSVAVIWAALTTVTLLTVMSAEETSTVAPARKFVPVRVTGTVAPWTPLAGRDGGEGRGGSVDGEDSGGGGSAGGRDGNVASAGDRGSRHRQGGGDLGGAHDGHVADGDIGGRDVHNGAGQEVRPGEGDRDRAALQAVGRGNRGQGRSGRVAPIDLDFTQPDVGAGSVVHGEADPRDGLGGERLVERRAIVGELPDGDAASVAEGQSSGNDVVGEIGPVVKGDVGNRYRATPIATESRRRRAGR